MGRTAQNKIVIFDGDAERMTGEIFDVLIEETTGFSLYGTPVFLEISLFTGVIVHSIQHQSLYCLQITVMHPYETISLDTAGYVLAAWLIGLHCWMLMKPTASRNFLIKLPRNGVDCSMVNGCWHVLVLVISGPRRFGAAE